MSINSAFPPFSSSLPLLGGQWLKATFLHYHTSFCRLNRPMPGHWSVWKLPGLVGMLLSESDLFQKLIFWHLLLQRKRLRQEDKGRNPNVCEWSIICRLTAHPRDKREWNECRLNPSGRICKKQMNSAIYLYPATLRVICHSSLITDFGSNQLWLFTRQNDHLLQLPPN